MSRGPSTLSSKNTATPKRASLGGRIRKARVHFNWSQRDLAAMLGLPQQAVSAWENDRWGPTGPSLILMAQIFGVPAAALQTGRGFDLPELAPGGAMAVDERDPSRKVPLPPPTPGGLWAVQLDGEERKPLTLEEAVKLLRSSAKNGDAVWMVVEKKPR